jgi:outer membrane autotransporter protein
LGNVLDNGIFAINRSDAFAFGGIISGTGAFQQNGTGTTILTATNTYIGGTTINGGTLQLGNGGAPYLVEVSPTTADRTNVTGTATLAGTVNAIFQSGNFISNNYTILSATGGRNGTFDTLTTTPLPSFLTAGLDYTPNAVLLTLTSGLAQITGNTPNQKAVGGALDKVFNTGGGLFLGFAGLGQSQIPAALDALSGEIHASVQSGLVDDSRFVRQAVLGRLRQAPYADASGAMAMLGGGGPTLAYSANGMTVEPAMAYAPRAKDAYAADFPVKARPAAPPPDPEMAFWSQAFGAWGRFDGDGNAADAKRTLGGFMSGFDRSFGSWRAGLAGGYTHSSLSVSARASSASVAGYAGSTFGAFNLRSGAAFSAHDIGASRSIIFPGFNDQTRASYDGSTAQAFGELGYGMSFGQIAAEPFAGLSFVRVATDAFREAGGAAVLGGAGESHQVGYSSIGARAATRVTMANGTVVMPRASLAWQHAFSNVTPTATLAFLGTGAGFTVAGLPLARDSALIDAGFDVAVRPNATLGLSYSGQLADNVRYHAVKGNATLRF